jgi:hypothetical protein
MVVWGGIGIIADDSGARYDPATDSWTPTAETTGVPSPRRWQTAIWTDLEMIVWGGVISASTDTGGVYCAVCNALDWHADLDLDIWMLPGNVQDVLFGADKQTLDWNAPALLGSTAVIYDTVRADTATTFDPAGV